jgi:hypothetical protein
MQYKNPYIGKRKIVNVVDYRYGINNQNIKLFENISFKISGGQDKLKQNYSIDNMDFSNHMTFDMLLDEQYEIVEFEGVYRRSWWPEGAWRIKNRYYCAEKYRHGGLQHERPTQPRILTQHQINFAKDNGAKFLFVSIEGSIAYKKLKIVMEDMVPYWGSNLSWIQPDNYYKVADCNNKACWQQIIYANITDDFSNTRWFTESLTAEQWRRLANG